MANNEKQSQRAAESSPNSTRIRHWDIVRGLRA